MGIIDLWGLMMIYGGLVQVDPLLLLFSLEHLPGIKRLCGPPLEFVDKPI